MPGWAPPNPGPFVVSHPGAVCRGQGCSACRGTGVARFFHGTKAELSTELLGLATGPTTAGSIAARPSST